MNEKEKDLEIIPRLSLHLVIVHLNLRYEGLTGSDVDQR